MLLRKIFRPILCSQKVRNTFVNKMFVQKAALLYAALLLFKVVLCSSYRQ